MMLQAPTSRGLTHAALLAAAALVSAARTDAQAIEGLGVHFAGHPWSVARYVSADGAVIVGDTGEAYGPVAFRWTELGGFAALSAGGQRPIALSFDGAVVALNTAQPSSVFASWWSAGASGDLGDLGGVPGFTEAYDLSLNGRAIVGAGQAGAAGERHAFWWTRATGMVDLDHFAAPLGLGDSAAEVVSSDGRVVIGRATSASGVVSLFCWTEGQGLAPLPMTPPGFVSVGQLCATPDLAVLFGSALSAAGWTPFRWTEADGVSLLGPPDFVPHDVSADGAVVVGARYEGVGGYRTVRWTAATGAQDLDAPSALVPAAAAVSADGLVVAGTTRDAHGAERAFRWSAASGLVDLGTFGGPSSRAPDLSADGGVVVGDADDSQGARQAFRVVTAAPHARYCDALPNSTGLVGRAVVDGSASVAANALRLGADRLPPGSVGLFLCSRHSGDIYPFAGSDGRLCLGGFIGRFTGPGEVQRASAAGTLSLAVDLTALPHPFGVVAGQPGESWSFQVWHRDVGGVARSNFTDAVTVTLQ